MQLTLPLDFKVETAARFVVLGEPQGYYSHGKVPNFDRAKRYHDYLERVRNAAALAGVNLPLKALKDCPVIINTVAYFGRGNHPDPENVRKAISDALFYVPKILRVIQGKGSGDKFCGGSFPPPLYDKANPRVEVEILRDAWSLRK